MSRQKRKAKKRKAERNRNKSPAVKSRITVLEDAKLYLNGKEIFMNTELIE